VAQTIYVIIVYMMKAVDFVLVITLFIIALIILFKGIPQTIGGV